MRASVPVLLCLCVLPAAVQAQERSPAIAQAQERAPAAAPSQRRSPRLEPVNQPLFDRGAAYYDAGYYAYAYRVFYWLAQHDDIAAMRNVALMKRKGQGTPRDPQGAMQYLKESARGGLPTAAADLAQMLLDGEAGPPDAQAALPWLKQAAEAHHPIAEFQLAEIYERGRIVPRDVGEAELLYADAAARGVPGAATRLNLLRAGAVSPPRP